MSKGERNWRVYENQPQSLEIMLKLKSMPKGENFGIVVLELMSTRTYKFPILSLMST